MRRQDDRHLRPGPPFIPKTSSVDSPTSTNERSERTRRAFPNSPTKAFDPLVSPDPRDMAGSYPPVPPTVPSPVAGHRSRLSSGQISFPRPDYGLGYREGGNGGRAPRYERLHSDGTGDDGGGRERGGGVKDDEHGQRRRGGRGSRGGGEEELRLLTGK